MNLSSYLANLRDRIELPAPNDLTRQIVDGRKRMKKRSVCYYPFFDSTTELISHFYRANWYLPRVEGLCEKVFFPVLNRDSQRMGVRPSYMGPSVSDSAHCVLKGIGEGFWEELISSKVVLLWKPISKEERDFFEAIDIKCVNVDTNDPEAAEYGEYCRILWKYLMSGKDRADHLKESENRFKEIAKPLMSASERACVFGTGPSLEKAFTFDFTSCLNIVCNSIVQNDPLMNHLQPKFLCAGDVVSHLGVSAYASQFRKDLVEQILERDIHFFTTAQFGFLLLVNHPALREKTILIDQTRKDPTFDLLEVFAAPQLDSTLNIHMLPLAATFADEIFLLGCDGKSQNRNNEDFWAHAKGSQYDDLVESGHRCHPTFDINRQKSTYDRYLKSVEMTVLKGEAEHGKKYWVLSPSNTLPLTSRLISEHRLKYIQSGKRIIT